MHSRDILRATLAVILVAGCGDSGSMTGSDASEADAEAEAAVQEASGPHEDATVDSPASGSESGSRQAGPDATVDASALDAESLAADAGAGVSEGGTNVDEAAVPEAASEAGGQPDAAVSIGCSLLADISPGIGSSSPASFVAAGGYLYFGANDGAHGVELWRTDGTAAGTQLVADVAPGAANGVTPNAGIVALRDVVYFAGNDGVTGSELWRSDGTAAGTYEVADVVPGAAGSSPWQITTLGSLVVFLGYPSNVPTLYRSDGTAAGTYALTPTSTTASDSTTEYFAVLDDQLYFSVLDSAHGREPWRTDGTVAGTGIVDDIVAGPSSSSPTLLATGSGAVYMAASDTTHGQEPWVTLGTTTTTQMLGDLVPGTGSSYPSGFMPFGGLTYFAATDANGLQMFQSDGTPAGTTAFSQIAPTGSSPGFFAVSGGVLVFSGQSPGLSGAEPYRTDGTVAGTYLLKDVRPGSAGSGPVSFTAYSGSVYFEANDGAHGTELWNTDGTPSGTSLVLDINPGAPDGAPVGLTVWGADLYFQANDDVHGAELWRCGPGVTTSVIARDGGAACPTAQAPSLVSVGAYCIDSSEVDVAEYASFLTAVGTNVSGQPSYCAFNTSYRPSTTGVCTGYAFDPSGHGSDPVVCVDWCDAAAYCRWAGKHLCGSTGGGSTSPYYGTDPGVDQWMNACSGGGATTYPYGSAYVAGACVDSSYAGGAMTLQPVLTATQCVGGFPGIFGMSGNAAEWEDSCNLYSGAADTCTVRGGSYSDLGPPCTTNTDEARNFAYLTVGFRCCAEVQ